MSSETSPQLVHKLGPKGIKIHREGMSDTQSSLEISFERTIRVSDNNTTNNLPPSLGSFPLFEASAYKGLPSVMRAKGGYFFPMHRKWTTLSAPGETSTNLKAEREAMWIRFSSKSKFAIKIYVGGVNAVSGEPSTDTEQTRVRRYKLLSQHKSIQDYIVAPKQLWLDGIASRDGTVRQFVAMPLGSGYTSEAQLTGADLIGGLQLEVVPAKEPVSNLPVLPRNPVIARDANTPHFSIYIKTLTGKTITSSV